MSCSFEFPTEESGAVGSNNCQCLRRTCFRRPFRLSHTAAYAGG